MNVTGWLGRAYGAARVAVGRSSVSRYPDFPNRVAIEPASACNLECPMCPTWTKSRKNGILSPALFRRLVDEIAFHGVERLFLHLWGEPLIHPEIDALARYASEKASIRETVMSTNATLLDGDRAEALVRSGLSRLVFSLDGATRETYEALRVGARFDASIENILEFLERRRRRGSGPRVVFQLIEMKQTVNEVEAFRSRWEPLLEAGDQISIKPYNQWADHDGALRRDGIPFRTPCFAFLWDFLAVTWNGTVLPCCYDHEAELVVGDARHQTLEQIWKGERLRELRRAHLELDFRKFPLCEGCEHTSERLDADRLKRMIQTRLRGEAPSFVETL